MPFGPLTGIMKMLRNVVDLVIAIPAVCGALILPPPFSCIVLCCIMPFLGVTMLRFFKRFLPGPLPGMLPI